MSLSEGKVLICKLRDSPGYVVPGALPDKCSWCGRGIWLSPLSIIILHDNPGMLTLCYLCTAAHMATHEGTVEPLTPAQLKEIIESCSGGEP